MSEFVTLECKYCGNADRSTFIIRESEYICKCCGRCYRENMSGGETRSIIGFETLKNYDFAAAESIFTDIIGDYPESVDARWGLLLAKYGIVFVKGFYMGEIEPIYCFPNYGYAKGSFKEEPEYKEIKKLLSGDPERFALYEKQAEQIEKAFEIFESDAGKKENDVFICVKISKTTANNPHAKGTTEDYEKACELYGKLRGEGKSVFFSYVTLKNTIDSDMEIWRNMLKSKKMLLIGSRTEYMNSVWVKSEWERWLCMDGAGESEHRKNLYIYVLGNENENLYAKLPAGLKRLHPQIYTESTESDLINDICHGGEEKTETVKKTPASPKHKEPKSEPLAKTEEKPQKAAESENKDGYVAFLDGSREVIPYGTQKPKSYCGRSDVAKVVLPASVTVIAEKSFSNCTNLSKIQIPVSVTKIEKGAFSGCAKLASVDIPSGVTEIGQNTFYMCKRLSSVKLADGIRAIGNGAFMFCESLKSISLPNGLERIEAEAFCSSGLKSVTVPKTVVSIGDRAFGGCRALERIKIYDSLTSLGNEAFDKSNTLRVTYSGTKNEFASLYKVNNTIGRGVAFALVCEKDPAVIMKRIKTAAFIAVPVLLALAAVIIVFTVEGSLPWVIAVPASLAVNMLISIISHHTDTGDEYLPHFVMHIIELFACLVLVIVGLAASRAVLIEAVAIAIGLLASTVYLIVMDDPEWGFKFLLIEAGALLIPIAIMTWSLLGLAIPFLVCGLLAVVIGIIWSMVEDW